MLLLIENGELFTPEPIGRGSVLIAAEKILHVGRVDRRAIDSFGIDCDVVDASDCIVTPGLIDPHEHLIGGSGEQGFGTLTPRIGLDEIVAGGITTVVGCLGVDTTTRTMPALLARAKGLRDDGITAFIYTGGYNVPPTTILDSVRNDILLISEIVGAGEIAIADERATEPSAHELARLVSDASVGGMLSGKAGVTHFHVGPTDARLSILRAMLDEYDVHPTWLYPTHVERSEALMKEAIALTQRGCTVDIDVVEKDLTHWLPFYLEQGGDPKRLTISSDAALTSPRNVLDQVTRCIKDKRIPLERVLPMVTTNTAEILKLRSKGRLKPGHDADALVLEAKSLTPRHVIARGHVMMRDSHVIAQERYAPKTDRVEWQPSR